jgi:hypothetical protein
VESVIILGIVVVAVAGLWWLLRQRAMAKYAAKTQAAKVTLTSVVWMEVEDSVYFEAGARADAPVALRKFLDRVSDLNSNFVYETTNSLPPDLLMKSKEASGKITGDMVEHARRGDLDHYKAYLMHNGLLRDFMNVNFMGTGEVGTRDAADSAMAMGLMRYCTAMAASEIYGPKKLEDQAWLQDVVVALTVCAGWMISTERHSLTCD